MGCSGSTVEWELTQHDIRAIKRVSKKMVHECDELMLALPFVFATRSQQYASLEPRTVARRVVHDEISVRSFAKAPEGATSRSIVMVLVELQSKARDAAADLLDPSISQNQLRSVGNREERLKQIKKTIVDCTRDAIDTAAMNICLGIDEEIPDDDVASHEPVAQDRGVHEEDQATAPVDGTHDSGNNGSAEGQKSELHDQPPSNEQRQQEQQQKPAVSPRHDRPRPTTSPRQSPGRRGPSTSPRKNNNVSPQRRQPNDDPPPPEDRPPMHRSDTMAPRRSPQTRADGRESPARQRQTEQEQKQVDNNSAAAGPKQSQAETNNGQTAAIAQNAEASNNATAAEEEPAAAAADTAEDDLPEGQWDPCDEEGEYYWSDAEQLYYHKPSGCFYDGDTGMWYDPESGEWFEGDGDGGEGEEEAAEA